MDFSVSDRVLGFRGLVREFMRKEVHPLEPRLRREGFAALLPQLRKVREKARETGLFAAHLPPEYGGAHLPLTEFAHLSEELGKSPLGHYAFNVQAPDIGNMELILEHGTAEQKERWLGPLARGEIRSCFSMTEPEFAGSNPVWLGTTATREGDEWVIRGHKWFASSADGAAFAVCMAVTSPAAKDPYRRASMIIVPTGTPGFELVGNLSIMGHRGADWMSHGEIMYHGARVPLSNLLGPEGGGFVLAQHRLGPGRIHHCMRWIGICERAFDILCEHASTRQLAPGRPARLAPDGPAVDRREPRRDRRRPAAGAPRRLEDRAGGRAGRPPGDLHHQVHGGPHPAARARPRHPGAGRAGHDRRHAAGLLVRPRARRPHLRRRRRGPHHQRGQAHPRRVRQAARRRGAR